jgi:hypothetical protein
MKELIEKSIQTVRSVADKASDEITSGLSLVKEKINLWDTSCWWISRYSKPTGRCWYRRKSIASRPGGLAE